MPDMAEAAVRRRHLRRPLVRRDRRPVRGPAPRHPRRPRRRRSPPSRSTPPAARRSSTPTGKWVLPGMVDIHTHYDVEVLVGPALEESRAARRDHDVPRLVLALDRPRRRRRRRRPVRPRRGDPARRTSSAPSTSTRPGPPPTSTSPRSRPLPLGPNLAAFIGHSDMRTATMGLDRATRKEVTPDQGRAAADGGDAHRGAGRRLRRHVRPAAALRQARRRRLPLAHPALDVRQAHAR